MKAHKKNSRKRTTVDRRSSKVGKVTVKLEGKLVLIFRYAKRIRSRSVDLRVWGREKNVSQWCFPIGFQNWYISEVFLAMKYLKEDHALLQFYARITVRHGINWNKQ